MTRRGAKILIVDDEATVTMTVADALRAAGCEVCGIAHTPDHAIVMARLMRPSLAVVDVRLGPDGDGVELARQLLRLGAIGILFLTGYTDELRLRADVGHAWLEKPFRPNDLVEAVAVAAALAERRPLPPRYSDAIHLIAG